ncbi:M1 family metallopeptidase [Flavobacterium sp. WW92]|uniref:M1 family metallopeptidase n=1 Tax=unclassified Flavobacterium TaxID=196869 RepID=UPI00222425D7|nr:MULTISPECIES: M1 family metallopeptidase [unclassified Flavobacterium]WDO12258.1 M1 family metallopeptidase [Flavobacterium sp. WW92]
MRRLQFLFLLFPYFLFSQQLQKVDFKTLNATLSLDTVNKKIAGKTTYVFEVLSTIDTIRIDAKNMSFSNLKINNNTVEFKNSGKELLLFKGFKKGRNTLTFEYEATPKQTLYFIGEKENLQIWTQGQGKYTSHWLPSFDDVNEKVIFGLTISFDKDFTVLSNGKLKKVANVNQAQKQWEYQMEKPMSSYLAMLAIGKFAKQTETTASGTPLEMYLSQEDVSKFEYTYKYSKVIFDFFENEIGVKYPWGIYRQVPVKDFLYGGMENTTSTIFSQDYVVDEIGFNDRNYINVNAHELAHQWFGDLITATSGKHHWLQEGFATYYALLAEKELFGEDHFNWEMYEIAERLQQASKTDTIPLMNEKASALTFYQKGAWALHVLRENVGANNFNKAVKKYLEKYAFKNVNTADFLAEINAVSKYDTKNFQEIWLEKSGFEVTEALGILQKNKFIKNYLDVLSLAEKPLAEKQQIFEETLKSEAYYPIKEEILFQLQSLEFPEKLPFIQIAMQSKDIKVRQAVAKTLNKFPTEFLPDFETFLDDNSYVTKEIALNVLWSQFPDNRTKYLDKSRNWIGMNDKNLRILWLTMALATKDFEPENKLGYYDELLGYASSNYESSIRQNALINLLYINPNDTNVLRMLVNPLTHHKWQFSKFARDKIRELIKKEKYKLFFSELLPSLPENEKAALERLLNP